MEPLAGILGQCGPVALEADEESDGSPSPPLLVSGGLALPDSEKGEDLADSFEAQFQPVNDPSLPAVI
jgi:hypothetical protein